MNSRKPTNGPRATPGRPQLNKSGYWSPYPPYPYYPQWYDDYYYYNDYSDEYLAASKSNKPSTSTESEVYIDPTQVAYQQGFKDGWQAAMDTWYGVELTKPMPQPIVPPVQETPEPVTVHIVPVVPPSPEPEPVAPVKEEE